MVRVPATEPSQRATVLNMHELNRPLAFALPMHPKASFEPPLAFDPHSAESVAAVMRSFEEQLRPAALQLCLAHEIARRRHQFRSPVFHLILEGNLVGVVVLGGAVGLSPALLPTDFERIEWSGRPASASAMGPDFLQSDMAAVMWRFTGRTQQDLLPQRYKEMPIHFRRMPRIDQRLIRDLHLLVMSELRTMPQTYAQLRAGTGMTEVQASQALAALYFAGSITTDPRKAMVPTRDGAGSAPDSDLDTSILGEEQALPSTPPRPGRRVHASGPSTVPTPLDRDR